MEYFAATEDDLRAEVQKLPNASAPSDWNIANNVLNLAYAFVWTIAVGFIIYAGIQYATANGDMNKVIKAKNTIIYAVVGLIIVLLAAAITFFITQVLAGAGTEAA